MLRGTAKNRRPEYGQESSREVERCQAGSRAVDQDGDVIDLLVQPRRDRRAAERFLRKVIEGA